MNFDFGTPKQTPEIVQQIRERRRKSQIPKDDDVKVDKMNNEKADISSNVENEKAENNDGVNNEKVETNSNKVDNENDKEKTINEDIVPNSNEIHRTSSGGNASVGNGSIGGMPVPKAPKIMNRQISEDSKTKNRRALHPAEKRAVMLNISPPSGPSSAGGDGYRKGPHSHSLNAFRRLSRADFRSIKNASKNLSIKEIMSRFERHSTIHGICHASLAPNKRWRHFWLVVFAICFAILVIQVIFLVFKFFQYPKTVDLDLKFENAPFPSVTLCNLNPYKASLIGADASVKATIDAFKNILEDTGRNEGIAAALANTATQRKRRELSRAVSTYERRYLQVYAQCYCEINRISAERKRGSCFAAYKGKISLVFDESRQLHNFHPTKCLCQLDWITKTLWPCFPYNTWKEHICTECVENLGHCPMRFYEYTVGQSNGTSKRDASKKAVQKDENNKEVCLCHREYNHCVANNENGEIPEIIPSADLEELNFTQSFVDMPIGQFGRVRNTTPTTTQSPETIQAMGFEELKDEIAIKTQARENLMFAVEEKPMNERVQLSQPKDELILKCSFNQHDCDIENDFKLFYDPTYGNCFTFNWNRTEAVTAHRAGANYGLRVLLYANVSEYLPTSEAVGFRITVHDKWTVPFADAFGHNAPTGFMSSFGVRMKKFLRLPPPYGHCSEGGQDEETYIYKDYNYSIEGCHRSCTQNEVIRECGCADPMFPVPENSFTCKVSDPSARECIKNTSRHLGIAIAQGNLPNCHCHQPCKETGYEVTYSAARWPSGTTKLMECDSNDDLCMEKYRKNAAMIQVFYEELNYETLSESVAYSMTSLFADLGGLTGLWIGISVVSILEVVQLAWFCVDSYRKKRLLMQERKQSSSSTRTPIQQNHFRRSLTSLNSVNKPTTKAPSNPSIGGKSRSSMKSSQPGEPIKLTIEEEEEGHHSTSSSGSSTPKRQGSPYSGLGPGEELPCTCLYGSMGHIVFMKPLCPFHGYMVRRASIYSETDYNEDERGNDALELTNEEKQVIERDTEKEQ